MKPINPFPFNRMNISERHYKSDNNLTELCSQTFKIFKQLLAYVIKKTILAKYSFF